MPFSRHTGNSFLRKFILTISGFDNQHKNLAFPVPEPFPALYLDAIITTKTLSGTKNLN